MVPKSLIESFVKVWNEQSLFHKVQEHTINSGWCYHFALLMKKVYRNKATLYSSCDHAWVKIGHKYYDSKNPEGVNLKSSISMCCCGLKCSGEILSKAELVKFWRHRGRSGPVKHSVINKAYALYKKVSENVVAK